METHWLLRFFARFRPQYGWLAFVMLIGALGCLLFATLEVGWVPEDRFIIPILGLGFLFAAWLAHRPVNPWVAWTVLIILGGVLSFFLVADLIPPSTVIGRGSEAMAEYMRLRAALFYDRAASWITTVRSGGRSTETVVFALGLALAGWLVATVLAWSAYRLRRPFLGLTLAGFALAANTFYGQSALHWAVFFFGLAITSGTLLLHLMREEEWERRGIDFPADVRTDLIFYTAGISLGVMSLAIGIPAINFRAIAETFQRQESVVAAEEAMARAFAGVAQPRTDEGTGRGGGLPRSFLVGGGPELAGTVVMTATISAEPPADLSAFHWRSISFDVYTGDGWQRSPEREENVGGGELIVPTLEPPVAGQLVRVTQHVDWTYDRRATRYTLGRPALFSHDIAAMWRGRDDFVGARGRNSAPNRYTVETMVVVATPDALRAAQLADVPPEIRARYTELPDTVPRRVLDLAREIAAPEGAGQSAPYDQAKTIENFLRQYPYTLDLPRPPPDVDIVDYFLFDLQTGFCDYYASAMVVMARAVGLPARLGVGFLQQPPDAHGVQRIRQLDAHSWAEIYFAGFGWVEFEPTAPFAGDAAAVPVQAETGDAPPTYTPGGLPVAIPERAPQQEFPWPWLLAVVAALLIAGRLWGRRLIEIIVPRYDKLDDIQAAYARLQDGAAALGIPPQPDQTPAEFALNLLSSPAFSVPEAQAIRPAIERLAALFAVRQYGQATSEALAAEAKVAWGAIGTPMRRLIWRRRLGGHD